MKNHYFDSLRNILDTKIPMVFDDMCTVVSPLAKSVLDFIKKPFSVGSCTFLDGYT